MKEYFFVLLFHQYNSAAPFKTITAQNNYSLLARNFHNFNGRGFRFGHFRQFLATFPMIFWVFKPRPSIIQWVGQGSSMCFHDNIFVFAKKWTRFLGLVLCVRCFVNSEWIFFSRQLLKNSLALFSYYIHFCLNMSDKTKILNGKA